MKLACIDRVNSKIVGDHFRHAFNSKINADFERASKTKQKSCMSELAKKSFFPELNSVVSKLV